MSFLSDALREALHRRLRELAGLALITASILLALALATWSVQDPQLSHATNAPVRNVLGVAGRHRRRPVDAAVRASRRSCSFCRSRSGAGGWPATGVLSRERIRLLFWIARCPARRRLCRLPAAAPTWPLPAGLGGVIGDWMLRLPTMLAGGTLSGSLRAAIAVVTGVATLRCFASWRAGFGWRADEEAAAKATVAEPNEGARRSRSAGSRTDFSASRRGGASAHAARAGARAARRDAADGRAGAEPRFDGRRTPPRWRRSSSRRTTRTSDEAPAARAAASRGQRRARRAARAAATCCRRSSCSPRPRRAAAPSLSADDAARQRHRAGRRARRFRRARRDHQCAAGPGGDPLRARAGAGHQVVARHRARRRHRPLHERALGARRGRGRAAMPSASSCPTRRARRSICASSSPAAITPTPPRSFRSVSARPSVASP